MIKLLWEKRHKQIGNTFITIFLNMQEYYSQIKLTIDFNKLQNYHKHPLLWCES